MAANEDYHSLVQDLNSVDFSGDNTPCTLLLTGDTAFPVVVTPNNHVLVAASRYGNGKVVAVAHESFLNKSEINGFLKNAITWLKPSTEAEIGVHNSLDPLAQTLSSFGFTTKNVSELDKDIGVLCITGSDDSQSQEIISFLREGGSLLIAADASSWSSSHPEANVLSDFPGNKISSVAGIYFSNKQGEAIDVNLSKDIPWWPNTDEVNFSDDLKQMLEGVSSLDIRGDRVPSQLLLHSALAFPVGLTNTQACIFAAAYYGKGRVFVGTHDTYPIKSELKTFILNAISWLDRGRNGKVGVSSGMNELCPTVRTNGFRCTVCDIGPDLSVYCCVSIDAGEIEKIHQFVADGGGLLIARQAWYWSSLNSGLMSLFPGNKIVSKFGISFLSAESKPGDYPALDYKNFDSIYQYLNVVSRLLIDVKKGEELKPPVSSWLPQVRRDAINFLRLPPTPLIAPLQEELKSLVKGFDVPTISKEHPLKNSSLESLQVCIAQELSSLDDSALENIDLPEKSVTVQINATNPDSADGDAWRSTGLYLGPKEVATFLFPASAVKKGLQVQVGCDSDDLKVKDEFYRAPVVVSKKFVLKEKVSITTLWGGLLYVVVKKGSDLGTIPVTIHGAEEAPTFINGQTLSSNWVRTIRNLPAPWAELITENIILTVPSESIRSLKDPKSVLAQWDKIMESVAELSAIPRKFPRPERIVADVQLSTGEMHSGYPIMIHEGDVNELLDVENMSTSGLWDLVHELGHNQQKIAWELGHHTKEATCNLWSVYVHETLFNISRNDAHEELNPEKRGARITTYIENGAKLDNWKDWTALELYLQLQEAFGWEFFKKLFAEYQTESNYSDKHKKRMNLWVEKSSFAANKNLAPFYKSWGWPVSDVTTKSVSNLPEWEENPMKKYHSAAPPEE